ncbi:MAG TPA: AAA family ATPase [Terriglobales bacterium]|nr:AAA family ATPase [Terriglobales bacterium]
MDSRERDEELLIGRFAIDLRRERLTRDGTEVHLRQQCWDVLACLARHVGQTLAKERLQSELWGSTAIDPNAIHYVLWDLRRSLARVDGGHLIEKIPRRGYRLALDDAGAATPVTVAQPSERSLGESAPSVLGREPELALLHRRLAGAANGQRQLVFVAGEPGIGKSALLDCFVQSVAGQGNWVVSRASCLPMQGAGEPYAPLLEAVEVLCAKEGPEDLKRHAPSWLVQMPNLLPVEEMEVLRQSLAGIGPTRMIREGVRLLEALSAERPVLLAIEDLQWVDAGTMDVLEAAAVRTVPARLMVLASVRTFEVAEEHDHARRRIAGLWSRLPQVTRIELEPLTGSAILRYLERRFGPIDHGAELGGVLEETSGGNPLFLTTLADSLVESGTLAKADGRWSLEVPVEGLELELPDSLREAIAERLEFLPAASIETLEAAGVAGIELTVAELAAAMGRPEEDLDRECARLASIGRFIVPAGQQSWPDGTTTSAYRFRHILYQRAVYERVAPATRRALHGRIGTRLAAAYGDRIFEVSTRVASHFEAAGDLEQVARYHDVAAALAITRFSPKAAMDHVRRAIQAISRLPDSRQRAERETARQLELGYLVVATKGFAEARSAFDRAYELADAHGDSELAFRAQMQRCATRLMCRDHEEALRIADWLVDTAKAQQPQYLAAAYYYSAIARTPFDIRGATQCVVRAREAVDAPEVKSPTRFDLRSAIELQDAALLAVAGSPEQAMAQANVARVRAAATRSPEIQTMIGAFCAFVAALAEDVDGARSIAAEALALAEENGIATYRDLARVCLCWATQRATPDGLKRFEESVVRRSRSKEKWFQGFFAVQLAEAFSAAGDEKKARGWMETAAELDEVLFRAELWRVRGERALTEGDRRAAKAHLRKAIVIARKQGATAFEKRARERYAEISQKRQSNDKKA